MRTGPRAVPTRIGGSLLLLSLIVGLSAALGEAGQQPAREGVASQRSLLAAQDEAAVQAAEVAAITARLALLELKTLVRGPLPAGAVLGPLGAERWLPAQVLDDPLGLLDNWQPETPTCRFKRVRTLCVCRTAACRCCSRA